MISDMKNVISAKMKEHFSIPGCSQESLMEVATVLSMFNYKRVINQSHLQYTKPVFFFFLGTDVYTPGIETTTFLHTKKT